MRTKKDTTNLQQDVRILRMPRESGAEEILTPDSHWLVEIAEVPKLLNRTLRRVVNVWKGQRPLVSDKILVTLKYRAYSSAVKRRSRIAEVEPTSAVKILIQFRSSRRAR